MLFQYKNLHADGQQIDVDELEHASRWQKNPWFAGKLARADSIAKFPTQALGTFLVRESNRGGRQGTYIIDVCTGNGDVKHVPIEREKVRWRTSFGLSSNCLSMKR